MNKIKVSLLVIGTILAIITAYFYNPFELNYIIIGVMALVAAIISATYLSVRKNIKAKAAASAVRRSAGASGVKKFDQKMLLIGYFSTFCILIVLKGYIFLIPMGIALLTFLTYRVWSVKVLLLIGYMATIYSAVGFIIPFISSFSSTYSLIVEGAIVLAFLFVVLPTADLYCIEK